MLPTNRITVTNSDKISNSLKATSHEDVSVYRSSLTISFYLRNTILSDLH